MSTRRELLSGRTQRSPRIIYTQPSSMSSTLFMTTSPPHFPSLPPVCPKYILITQQTQHVLSVLSQFLSGVHPSSFLLSRGTVRSRCLFKGLAALSESLPLHHHGTITAAILGSRTVPLKYS